MELDRPSLDGGWKVGSSIVLSVDARERRDLEGSADWEKGVVGEIKADPSAEPAANVVSRAGRESFLDCLDGV